MTNGGEECIEVVPETEGVFEIVYLSRGVGVGEGEVGYVDGRLSDVLHGSTS